METANIERIHLARDSRGINQGEMANRLGMAPGTLSKIEAGDMNIQPTLLQRIADITNYPLSFFYAQGHAVPDSFSWRKREKVAQKVITPIHAVVNILRLQIQELTRLL